MEQPDERAAVPLEFQPPMENLAERHLYSDDFSTDGDAAPAPWLKNAGN